MSTVKIAERKAAERVEKAMPDQLAKRLVSKQARRIKKKDKSKKRKQ